MTNIPELPDGERSVVRRSPQREATAYYAAPAGGRDAESDDLHIILRYVRMAWKRKWIIALCLVLGGLAGLAQTLRTTPVYRATASLEVQNIQEPFRTLIGGDVAIVTHSQLLASRVVRDAAAAKLSAEAPLETPETNDALAGLRGLLGLPNPLDAISWRQAVNAASGSVSIETTRDSRLLTIRSESPNPLAAAEFANALGREYVLHMEDERWQTYQNVGGMLDQAQEELKQKLDQSERELANFASASGLLVMTTSLQSVSEQDFRQVQTDLAAARTERSRVQARYEASVASLNEALVDQGPLADYQSRITALRREIAELSAHFTPAHYRIQDLEREIAELQTAMENERGNVSSRLRIEYQAAQERENTLQREFDRLARVLADQAQTLSQYNMLRREVEINRNLYEAMLQQGKEASVSSAMRANNARLADPARVPGSPYKPNLQNNLLLGMIGGFFFGALGAVVRSRMDASIQEPGVLRAYLDVRELGAIPSARIDPEVTALPRESGKGKILPAPGGKTPAGSLELVTWNRRRSVLADAYRAAMTSILFSGPDGERPRVILVTSPAPQEGKSTTIGNLAIAFAEIGNRVLLVDGDMRLPRLHTIFDLPNTFGLSTLLNDLTPIAEMPLEALVRKTAIPGLDILPAGPGHSSLSRLLHSPRMRDLMARLRGEFDTILIDSAPILTVPDGRVLARLADGAVLVLRARKTTEESAVAAAKCLEEDGGRLLGTILNDFDPNVGGYGYGRYGRYSGYTNA